MVAAFVVSIAIEPEYRRTESIRALDEMNAIHAPWITLFSGGPATTETISEPTWFSVRQRIAKICCIHTTPWHSCCRLGYRTEDAEEIARLVSSCEVLQIRLARESDHFIVPAQ